MGDLKTLFSNVLGSLIAAALIALMAFISSRLRPILRASITTYLKIISDLSRLLIHCAVRLGRRRVRFLAFPLNRTGSWINFVGAVTVILVCVLGAPADYFETPFTPITSKGGPRQDAQSEPSVASLANNLRMIGVNSGTSFASSDIRSTLDESPLKSFALHSGATALLSATATAIVPNGITDNGLLALPDVNAAFGLNNGTYKLYGVSESFASPNGTSPYLSNAGLGLSDGLYKAYGATELLASANGTSPYLAKVGLSLGDGVNKPLDNPMGVAFDANIGTYKLASLTAAVGVNSGSYPLLSSLNPALNLNDGIYKPVEAFTNLALDGTTTGPYKVAPLTGTTSPDIALGLNGDTNHLLRPVNPALYLNDGVYRSLDTPMSATFDASISTYRLASLTGATSPDTALDLNSGSNPLLSQANTALNLSDSIYKPFGAPSSVLGLNGASNPLLSPASATLDFNPVCLLGSTCQNAQRSTE